MLDHDPDGDPWREARDALAAHGRQTTSIPPMRAELMWPTEDSVFADAMGALDDLMMSVSEEVSDGD